MKMIVISEDTFNKLFEDTLKDLELDKLREKDRKSYVSVDDLHRKFHYTVSVLKDKLAKA